MPLPLMDAGIVVPVSEQLAGGFVGTGGSGRARAAFSAGLEAGLEVDVTVGIGAPIGPVDVIAGITGGLSPLLGVDASADSTDAKCLSVGLKLNGSASLGVYAFVLNSRLLDKDITLAEGTLWRTTVTK